jgi:protein phosphatase
LLEYVQRRTRSSSDPRELITSAIESAARTVYAAGERSVRYAGMGTTVVACRFSPPNQLAIGHAGDSRAYRLRSGHLEALTTDHNQAQEWLSQGILTAEEAERSDGRHLLSRNLGHEDGVTPDVDVLTLEPGDRVLLCSDGLHGQVTSDVLRDVLGAGEAPEIIAQAFIDITLAGDAPDNVTAVVIVVEAQPSTRPAPT